MYIQFLINKLTSKPNTYDKTRLYLVMEGVNNRNWLTEKMRRPEDDGPTLAVLRSGHTMRLMSCRK